MIDTITTESRSWTDPNSARRWLNRNPDVTGVTVQFDRSRAVYCLRAPTDETSQEIDTMAKKPRSAEKSVNRSTKTAPVKVNGKVSKEEASKAAAEFRATKDAPAPATEPTPAPATDTTPPATPAPVEAKPLVPVPGDPAAGIVIKNCIFAIDGLPLDSTAYTWAIEISRKLDRDIVIHDLNGGVLAHITRAHFKAVKEAKAANAKANGKSGAKAASGEPKAPKSAPDGKRMEVVNLAMRPEGATVKELIALTGWTKAPWKWTFSNPQGTGLANRYGYNFRTEKVDGETRYFLTSQA